MCNGKLITGIKVTQQMSKAHYILHSQVIPREELFQIRQKEGKLSQELTDNLNRNADKIVIAPSKWFRSHETLDILPENWTKI